MAELRLTISEEDAQRFAAILEGGNYGPPSGWVHFSFPCLNDAHTLQTGFAVSAGFSAVTVTVTAVEGK